MNGIIIHIRHVPRYGWLATIEQNDNEIYRGEYQENSYASLLMAGEWAQERRGWEI